jgi:hypothetical protein
VRHGDEEHPHKIAVVISSGDSGSIAMSVVLLKPGKPIGIN